MSQELEHVTASMEELQRPDITPKRRKELDKFLLDFQRSRRAWEVCLESLRDMSQPVALRMLLAQTIRQKARRDCIMGSTSVNSAPQKGRDASAETLSTTEFHSLVAPIGDLCAKEQHSSVRLQLCLTLSALLLRGETDPAQAISETLQLLRSTGALLAFVSGLPDEWGSDGLKVSPDRRAAGLAALRDSIACQLLPLLHHEYTMQPTDEAREALLQCFTTWLTTGCVRPDQLLATPFVEDAARALSHEPLTHAACEVLIGAVEVGGAVSMAPVLQYCTEALRAASVQAAAGDEDAVSRCEALIGPIMALTEASVDGLCQGTCSNAEQLIEVMFECTTHTCIGVATHAMGFWSALRAAETRVASVSGCQRLTFLDALYTQAFGRLASRSSYPTEAQWADMDDDSREEVYMFRKGVRDVLRSVVIGREGTMGIFLGWAQGALNTAMTMPGCTAAEWKSTVVGRDSTLWQPLEAVIHALMCVVKSVELDETTYMPGLMGIICNLPPGHAGTALSAVSCISQAAQWLSTRPELLQVGFDFVIESLPLPTNPPGGFLMCTPGSDDNYAAVSLLQLCTAGSTQLAQLGAGPRLVKVHAALEAQGVHPQTMENVLKSVCEVLSVLPPQDGATLLEALCSPVIVRVCSLGAEGVTPDDAIHEIRRVEAVVGHVRMAAATDNSAPTEHPAVVILRCAWEAIPPLILCEHPGVQAAACNVLRAAVRNAGMDLGAMLVQFIDDSATAIERAPSGLHRVALLWVLEGCAKVRCPTEEVVQHLRDAVAWAGECVLPIIAQHGPDHDPELTQRVFDLGRIAAEEMPGAVGPHLLSYFRCAISVGLKTQQRDAGMAVLKFVKAVADWCGVSVSQGAVYARNTAANTCIEEMGTGLVCGLLRAMDSQMLSWALIPCVDIMRQLHDTLGAPTFEQLVRAALVVDDVPRVGVKQSTKERFVVDLLGSESQADKKVFKKLIKSFCGGKKKGDLSSQQKGACFKTS